MAGTASIRIAAVRSLVVLMISCAALSYVGCRRSTHDDHRMTQEEAFQIAVQCLKDVRPQWTDALSLPREVTDHGDYWLVTFVLPENTVGGTPVIHVDKQQRKVVKAYHEQ